jgi:hypothetical protein
MPSVSKRVSPTPSVQLIVRDSSRSVVDLNTKTALRNVIVELLLVVSTDVLYIMKNTAVHKSNTADGDVF